MIRKNSEIYQYTKWREQFHQKTPYLAFSYVWSQIFKVENKVFKNNRQMQKQCKISEGSSPLLKHLHYPLVFLERYYNSEKSIVNVIGM